MGRSGPSIETQWLLIPIETKAREFHGKILLSCFAAEAGLHVILGEQNELRNHLGRLFLSWHRF